MVYPLILTPEKAKLIVNTKEIFEQNLMMARKVSQKINKSKGLIYLNVAGVYWKYSATMRIPAGFYLFLPLLPEESNLTG